jgi:hypothetical protein
VPARPSDCRSLHALYQILQSIGFAHEIERSRQRCEAFGDIIGVTRDDHHSDFRVQLPRIGHDLDAIQLA